MNKEFGPLENDSLPTGKIDNSRQLLDSLRKIYRDNPPMSEFLNKIEAEAIKTGTRWARVGAATTTVTSTFIAFGPTIGRVNPENVNFVALACGGTISVGAFITGGVIVGLALGEYKAERYIKNKLDPLLKY